MEHIKRMENELEELEEKIKNAKEFLEKEFIEPKFTDEAQRQSLAIQVCYMIDYSEILRGRIRYDKNKELV